MMDGQMHPGFSGQLQMGQGQIPTTQKPQDQPMSLPVMQAPPQTHRQMPLMQMKSHAGATYGHRENLAYCALPVEHMQRLQLSQPCHPLRPPGYGQPMYQSQQVNQPVQHTSLPSGHHQSMYFRPCNGVGVVYPKMQGLSHGWGEYRLRMEQMPMYSPPSQHGVNPSVYINQVGSDQFGNSSGASPLEAKRFSSPNLECGSGLCYHGPHTQHYQQYTVSGKPSNMGWHVVDHSVQRSVDQPHQQQHNQSGHPVNIGETGFPRQPSAMHLVMPNAAAAAGQTAGQNYIPGRRLEHFSPGLPGCGSSTMSPSRLNADCLDEFSPRKAQPAAQGAAEFSSHQYPIFGPMLSPGRQPRQGTPVHCIDVGEGHPGGQLSHAYGPQAFGDNFYPHCQYPNMPRLQQQNFYRFTGMKCESNTVGKCFNQESSTAVGCGPVSSTSQDQIHKDSSEQHLPVLSEMDRHMISGPMATSFVNTPAAVTLPSVASGITGSILSPSLERISCTLSSQPDSYAIKNCDDNEQNRQNVFDRVLKDNCVMSSPSSGPRDNSLLTAGSGTVFENPRDDANHRDITLSSASSEKSTVTNFTTLTSALPSQNILSVAAVNVACSSVVVTQVVSVSVAYAMTTSAEALASKQCTLTTASVAGKVSAPLTVNDSPSSISFERPQSDFFTDLEQEKNFSMVSMKLHHSPPFNPPRSIPSLLTTQLPSKAGVGPVDNAEPTACHSHQKPIVAKRRKVKLKGIEKDSSMSYGLEFPKLEADLTSIKLEETDETASTRQGSFSCADSDAVKQTFDSLSKDLCLRSSSVSLKDYGLPATLASCVQRADVTDVKDLPLKFSVSVPFGWRRKLRDGQVLYLSPTDVELESLDEVRHYLLTEGTCKCGLQCPLVVDQVFVFDPDIDSRHLCADDVRCDMDMTNLCNHKRKIVAMATFQHSTGLQMSLMERMQFRTSETATAAAAVPSVGFENRSECNTADLPDPFPGKLPHSSAGLLETSSQKPLPECPPGNADSYLKSASGRFRGLSSTEERIYGIEGNGSWPLLTSSTKSWRTVKGLASCSSYSLGNCGRRSEMTGHVDQSFGHTVSSPNLVNQSAGSFTGKASGYRMAMHSSGSFVGGLMPHVSHHHHQQLQQQQGSPAYGSNRPLWPPFDENRFSTPYYSQPGHFGMQIQPKLCPVDSVWPCHQPATANRFGMNALHSNGKTLDEQADILSARSYDIENQVGFEMWGPSKCTPGNSRSIRKFRKKGNKREKPYSCILEKSMPCPNIDVRQIIQEQQERIQVEAMGSTGSHLCASNSADNLTTFLAQQTVLVNQTLPSSLGYTSPADDSDVTQSASTICGSTDDVASCTPSSHSSPLEKTFSMLLSDSSSCLDDKKISDDTLKGMVSMSGGTGVNSACHVTLALSPVNTPQISYIDASHSSAEAGVDERSDTGGAYPIFTEQNMPVADSCMTSNATPAQQCFIPSVEVNKDRSANDHFLPKILRDQLSTKVFPAPFSEPISQKRFSSPDTLSHQLPQYPYTSNHLFGNIAPTWLYSDPVHSRNQLYFPSGSKSSASSVTASGAICSNMSFNQHGLSVSGRHGHVSRVCSHPAAGVPDNCGILRPGFQTCSLEGNQTSETYFYLPEGVVGGGGSTPHRCTAEARQPYLYGQPASGCTPIESPISLVQNMVSGLVTTQNSLAMVTSTIVNQQENSRRRKSGGCGDASRTVLSQSVSLAANFLGPGTGDEVEVSAATTSVCVDMLPATCMDCPAIAGSICLSSGLQVNLSEIKESNNEHLNAAKQPVPMTAVTAVTNVTQVIPTAGIQPSFGHPLHVPPMVQILNPLNIALPGTQILLNDQMLAFGGQDSALLQQGLAMSSVGQLHIAPHPPQSQMVVFPTGQGPTVVAIQPSQSALVPEFAAEESSHGGEVGQAEEEEEEEEVRRSVEAEEMDADDIMRTTGTQTSTPALSFSNCNSLDSGENDLDSSDVLCPDQSVSSSTREDVGITVRDGKRATRKGAQPAVASLVQQGQMSTAQVVVMPSVPQQPFVLPQGVALAGALGGQGYFQLQQPVDFGFNPNQQVGLIHFGQITATGGGLIPTQALVGAMSVAGGGFVSNLAPEQSTAAQNLSSKSDSGSQPAFGAAEILHFMSPGLPQGHILVQNMPSFASFAGAILPVVPQAALGTAICNFGGAQTIFAVGQGSLGIVTSVGTAVVQQQQQQQQMPSSDQPSGDVAPQAPDSTVDSEEPISSNVVESELIITSTDAHRTAVVCAELCSSREQVVVSASGQIGPFVDLDSSRIEESPSEGVETSQPQSHSPEVSDGKSYSEDVQMIDNGIPYDKDLSQSKEERDSPSSPGPSYASLSLDQSYDSAPVKLVKCRRRRKLKLHNQRRHIKTFVSPFGDFVTQTSELQLKTSQETEETALDTSSSMSTEGASTEKTINKNDNFATDVPKSQESSSSSSKVSSASTSMECHVTTSMSCDYGDSSVCRTQRPRASRLRMKIEQTGKDQLNFSKCHPSLKRSLEEEAGNDDRSDDADSTTSLPSISYPRLFNIGDLVWGPARGFPSWPGKLVPESEVRGNPKTDNGKIWVKWFGDHTFTQAEPEQLKTLSEGLETHHNARKKHRKGRRMNARLEAAIQEAMVELDRQMVEEQNKQSPNSSSLPNKTPPMRSWGSRRTRK